MQYDACAAATCRHVHVPRTSPHHSLGPTAVRLRGVSEMCDDTTSDSAEGSLRKQRALV